MLIRYRMNKLIRVLEKGDSEALNEALCDPQYQKALQALTDQGCVKVVRDMSGAVHAAWLLDHYTTYQLSRQDVWKNRLWGFLVGIATSVAAHHVIVLVDLWLSSR